MCKYVFMCTYIWKYLFILHQYFYVFVKLLTFHVNSYLNMELQQMKCTFHLYFYSHEKNIHTLQEFK